MLTEEIAMFVTPLYAGLLTLWFTLLSVRVMNLRRRGIAFGDGGDIGVTRIIRAQANFAEYVPLALLLMGFLEVTRYSISVVSQRYSNRISCLSEMCSMSSATTCASS